MDARTVVIVGAGAAGVGAGLALQERGVPFVILEAQDRIGGRAYTDTTSLGVPWDQGCHWLHCADVNPLVAWANRVGTDYVKQVREDHFTVWQDGGFVSAADLKEADAKIDAAFEAVETLGREGRDVPITDILPNLGKWHEGTLCVLALMAGDDARDVSAAGYSDYAETETNWPVASGYGDLIERMAEGLPIRTGVAVTRIDQTEAGARLTTSEGQMDAAGVIVTASTNVLAGGGIAFGPGAAADVVADLANVPCGAYEKVAFSMTEIPGPVRGKTFCSVQPEGLPAVSLQVVERSDPPLLIAHFAGDTARTLAAKGADGMIAAMTGYLRTAFGPGIEDQIIARAATGWTHNPYVRGSYSHARPGSAQLRRDLIARDTGRVGFAGEGFSLQWQATAHGAWQSGQDVAARIAAHLG